MTETHDMLVKVYGQEAVSKKCVYEWFKCFADGKEDVKDELQSRPPYSKHNSRQYGTSSADACSRLTTIFKNDSWRIADKPRQCDHHCAQTFA